MKAHRLPSRETTLRMKAVRQRDTSAEMRVRRLLHGFGIRYRVCQRGLPGSPDISNRAGRWCVFVHGCFWHGHDSCAFAKLPKTNVAWWKAKIDANRSRDRRKAAALRARGFDVSVVWECQTRDEPLLRRKLARIINKSMR
jgi:DNA mismatch endonuclease, patch repair protein